MNYERALAVLGEMEARTSWHGPELLDALRCLAALRRVLEMHSKTDMWCLQCSDAEWPCPTVRAIAEALGGDDMSGVSRPISNASAR